VDKMQIEVNPAQLYVGPFMFAPGMDIVLNIAPFGPCKVLIWRDNHQEWEYSPSRKNDQLCGCGGLPVDHCPYGPHCRREPGH
jgi:hypothetical protein